jgi:signal transduction histidine kinase
MIKGKSSIEPEISRALRHELYERGLSASIAQIAVLMITRYLSNDLVLEVPRIQFWMSFILLGSLLRFYFARLGLKQNLTGVYRLAHDVGIAATGWGWGLTAVEGVFSQGGLVSLPTVSLFVIGAGIVASSATSVSPARGLYLIYILSVLSLPGAAVALLQTGRERVFGLLVVVFGGFLFLQSRLYVRNLIAKLKMTALAKKEKEHLEEIVRYQTENQAQREKMMNSSRMASLGEMATGLAHEINNPLCVVLMRIDRLQAEMKAGNISQEHM